MGEDESVFSAFSLFNSNDEGYRLNPRLSSVVFRHPSVENGKVGVTRLEAMVLWSSIGDGECPSVSLLSIEIDQNVIL
jgi:hypothetical protein